MHRTHLPILILTLAMTLSATSGDPPTVVPEPSTWFLLGTGVVGAVLFAKNRRSKR
jgi:PEP-CTERM motif